MPGPCVTLCAKKYRLIDFLFAKFLQIEDISRKSLSVVEVSEIWIENLIIFDRGVVYIDAKDLTSGYGSSKVLFHFRLIISSQERQ